MTDINEDSKSKQDESPADDTLVLEERQDAAMQSLFSNAHSDTFEAETARRFVPDRVEVSASISVDEVYAEGGMGVVAKAQDEKLKLRLAVKFLRKDLAVLKENQERFRREAQITSELCHSGIVTVVGQNTAFHPPFYVMHFLEGEDLDEAIKKLPVDIQERKRDDNFLELLRALANICLTIQYAHDKDVIHRDIKPSNIRVRDYGEYTLLDWGLAVKIGEDAGELGYKDFDRNYSSPLYARPGRDKSSPSIQDDIYSLGVILHKIVTGVEPMRTASGSPVFDYIDRRSKTLSAVCAKALGERGHYSSAEKLAQDIHSYLTDKEVSAVEDGLFTKALRLLRHNKHIAMGTAMGIMFCTFVLLGLVAIFWYQGHQLRLQQVQHQFTVETESREYANQIGETLASRFDELRDIANREEAQTWLGTKATDAPDWIRSDFQNLQCRFPSASWFAIDKDGTLRYRFPEGTTASKDYNFTTRDYFHGKGFNDENQATVYKAYSDREFYLSIPFVSIQNGSLMVALSVLAENDSETLGVVCCTIDAKLLLSNNALLIHAKNREIDTVAEVLDHPAYRQESKKHVYLDVTTAKNILKTNAGVIENFLDPINMKYYRAVVAPVRLHPPYEGIKDLFVVIRLGEA